MKNEAGVYQNNVQRLTTPPVVTIVIPFHRTNFRPAGEHMSLVCHRQYFTGVKNNAERIRHEHTLRSGQLVSHTDG
jgi:hypothetical protein